MFAAIMQNLARLWPNEFVSEGTIITDSQALAHPSGPRDRSGHTTCSKKVRHSTLLDAANEDNTLDRQ